MRGSIRKITTFICWMVLAVSSGPALHAAEQYRVPGEQTIEDFRSDSNYSYERQEFSKPPIWDWVVYKLQQFLKWIFGAAPSGKNITNFFLILSGIIVLWAIFRLLGLKLNTVFSKQPDEPELGYNIKEENIYEIDFARAIEEAREQQKWRLVIRLQYLLALRLLAERELVKVKNGKTNHDYLYELSAGPVKEAFGRLSRLFEYTWYGHFEAVAEVRTQADSQLERLRQYTSGHE